MSSSQKKSFFLKVAAKIRLKFVNRNYIDRCDTPSYMTEQIVQKYYGIDEVFIARNGTAKIKTNEQPIKKDKEFIYIGRLSKGRNTDKLLEAFVGSNKSIDIFGFGEMENIVNEYSKEYSNINFYGKVAYTHLMQILPKYQYGIDLTYVNTEFGKASYSQKIAQYLSFGLNVLAIDCVDNQFIKNYGCGQLFKDSDTLGEVVSNFKYKEFDSEKIKNFIYSDQIVNQLIEFWKQK
jgi:glycosyltransferase involved in cell wall biosynthesis